MCNNGFRRRASLTLPDASASFTLFRLLQHALSGAHQHAAYTLMAVPTLTNVNADTA